MSINPRHLHAFRETARLGSINTAARAVHLSQPALSQAIAGVERHFGAALLKRTRRGVTLTKAGMLAVDRIERALDQLRDGLSEISPPESGTDLRRWARLAQLDALAAVVEHRTFSAAARARGLAQPTIHRAARELERSVGVPLFEKTSFGVIPTRAAERLARRTKLAFSEIAQARAEIAALSGGESGATVIGAMPLARSHLIPSALIEFTRRFPRHRVGIIEGTYEYMIGALKSSEVDFLVGAMRDPSVLTDVVQEHLFDDPLSIVARADHPLAGRKRVAIRTLLQYPWIAPRTTSPLRAHFNALFKSAGFAPPDTSIECNSPAAARALLIESDHLMLLSAHQIHYELRAGMLTTLPHPAGRVTRPIGLTYRRDWRPTDAQRQLIAHVKARAHAR